MARIAVIDDDPSLQRLVKHWLEREGHQVVGMASGAEALQGSSELPVDLVLLDLELGDMDGRDVLEQLLSRTPDATIIMMTANGEVPAVVDAMRRGAYDYLVKPVTRTQLRATVLGGLAGHTPATAPEPPPPSPPSAPGYGMTGTSAPMLELIDRCERVAATDVTVLIQGESGTGKELVARALHGGSGRAQGPFVAISCAAVAPTLQESELFGHIRGAFTGAHKDRKGRFEQAHGGTIFLDEVAELAPDLQAKLLRVLQERTLYRVGGDEQLHVDVRVLAASHRDLGDLVAQGRFREDLYYRLAVFELRTPPLRERGGDILLLAERFLSEAAHRLGRAAPRLEPATRSLLLAHPWPGNVRELRNAMETAAVTAGPAVSIQDLPARLRRPMDGARSPVSTSPASMPKDASWSPMERIERDTIQQALHDAGGNVSKVIRHLGIPRTSLYRKLHKYGLR